MLRLGLLRFSVHSNILKHCIRCSALTPNFKTVSTDLDDYQLSKNSKVILRQNGIESLTEVQASTFEPIYSGEDVITKARTGTGKTFAFVLPIVESLAQGNATAQPFRPLVLVLAPTRELAIQVHRNVKLFVPHSACVYGGAPYQKQEEELGNAPAVLIATPGRLLDFINRTTVDLSFLRHVVIDEVDRLLDMGFTKDVELILKECSYAKPKPQMLFFSATVPRWVINAASQYMNPNYKRIDLVGNSVNKTPENVRHLALQCPASNIGSVLADVLRVHKTANGQALIFTKTKDQANKLALGNILKLDCRVLHGGIEQKQREQTFQNFRKKKFSCLVATDVAARGLDIPEIDLVIQTGIPEDIDSYIHRAGRTGRAGRHGVSICLYEHYDRDRLDDIERAVGIKFNKISLPTQDQVLTAIAEESAQMIKEIPEKLRVKFVPAAEKLLETHTPTEILSSALAAVSGYREIGARSLITHEQGFVTLKIDVSRPMFFSEFSRLMRRCLPNEISESISNFKQTANAEGVIFDVPEDNVEELLAALKDLDYEATVITELPPLFVSPYRRPPSFRQKQKFFHKL